eukprot:CAMPEP_0181246406 /NCGR_PEP_ID=MMETSP1096-20121128/43983_1 /TAXON_ID=156174 ORGANISM="Chrysochromulina ericina, Strain CCMP281" /NCGR_SAMPLE_ID=MMETSP1096 /ASSEMBLY_ACC=CAM_ASM_000453 /LENGTH=463 /DNA_ID=CAMNT_0023343233 /DNA_START=1 /DNA_END=1392 /DNA_ORIENTATION=+
MDYYDPYMEANNPVQATTWKLGSSLIQPLTMLVGFLTALRVNDAYNKWMKGSKVANDLAAESKFLMTRVCNYVEYSEQAEHYLLKLKRMMVLACVCIRKHVRGEKENDFEPELRCGLITKLELAEMTNIKMMFSAIDNKGDRFPSKHRPAYAFYKMHEITAKLARSGLLHPPPYHLACDAAIQRMSNTFDHVEMIGKTQMPLPYAQVCRFTNLLFLLLLPFAVVRDIKWLTIPLSFVANLVYNTIDRVASEMEHPFGSDTNDVDVDKEIRRIDKNGSALLALWMRKPVMHFDVFPEAKKEKRLQNSKGVGEEDSIYFHGSSKNLPVPGGHIQRMGIQGLTATEQAFEIGFNKADHMVRAVEHAASSATHGLEVSVTAVKSKLSLQPRHRSSASCENAEDTAPPSPPYELSRGSRPPVVDYASLKKDLEEEEDLELGESGGNALGPGEAPDDDYIESDGDVQED